MPRQNDPAVRIETTTLPGTLALTGEALARRDKLILEHLPLVRAIAAEIQKMSTVHVEFDDLVLAGIMGLFDAAANYRDVGKVAFSTHATAQIRRAMNGAMASGLRQQDLFIPYLDDRSERSEFLQALHRELSEVLAKGLSGLASEVSSTPQVPTKGAKRNKRKSRNAGDLPGLEGEKNKGLFAHAVETFGSRRAALGWFSSQCGALNNQTPSEVVGAGQAAEVERILDCIDYGMFA